MKKRFNWLRLGGYSGAISIILLGLLFILFRKMIELMSSFENYKTFFVLSIISVVIYIVSSMVFLSGFYVLGKKVKSRYIKLVSIVKMLVFLGFIVVFSYFLLNFEFDNFKNTLAIAISTSFLVSFLFGAGLIYLYKEIKLGLVAGAFEISKILGLATKDSITLYAVLWVITIIIEIIMLFVNSERFKKQED